MRFAAALFLAAIATNVRADCTKDTTKHEPRTLFGQLGIKAMHIDEGGGTAPLSGDNAGIVEGRFAFAHCRLPAYTFAFVGGQVAEWRQTAYVVPGSDYHPRLYVGWNGIEAARRWRETSIFHPMVSLALGSLTAEYPYSRRQSNGEYESHVDGHSTARFYTPSVGVEASLFKYMTAYYMFGSRFVGPIHTPNVSELSGTYSVLGFGFGKFR